MERLRDNLGTWVLATAAGGVVIGFLALVLLGGQVSSVLSTVGASIGSSAGGVGSGGNDTAGGSQDGTGQGSTAGGSGASGSGGASGGNGASGSGGSGSAAAAIALQERAQLVFEGRLQLVVDDVPATLDRAREVVGSLGGYVGASRETLAESGPVAELTFRIPSDGWDAGLAAIRGLSTEVVHEETSAVEAGPQLVDLDARVRNLRTSEGALQAIAAQAGSIGDLVKVEGELSKIRGEIERLEAQRTQLGDRVAYGTLVVAFGVEVVAVTVAAEGWNPATEVDAATAHLISIAQALASIGIWFGIVWLPVLVIAGLGLGLVVGLVRFAHRRMPGLASSQDTGWGSGA
jgi:hypothetical protein